MPAPSNPKQVTQGARFARFKKGFSVPSILSVSFWNKVLDALEALCNLEVRFPVTTSTTPTGKLHLSESNAVLELELPAGGGSGTGNLNYRGLYSSGTDYAVNDCVYTAPDSNTRHFWVCEIANTHSSQQAPTWPEPGTIYWRRQETVAVGWNWSAPPEFNSATAYYPGQVVNVASGNAAIASGAVAGKYICVNPTAASTPSQYPQPEPNPATSGGSWLPTVYWVQIGGGGTQRFRVKSLQGDYMTCRTWDGTTEGSVDILVAKPYALRHSLGSEIVNGITWTFSYSGATTNNSDGNRTATATGQATETHYVEPVYHVNAFSDGY